MKKFLSLLAVILALTVCLGMAAYAADDAAVAVSGATGAPGDTVTLTVSLTSNPGIAYLKLPIQYDADRLEEPVTADAGALSGWTLSPTEPVWYAASNDTSTGDILTLTFKIKDDAPEGAAVVNFGSIEAWTDKDEAVAVQVSSGTVTVEPIPCPHTTLIPHEETPASCTEAGYKAYWECGECHKLFSDSEAKNEIAAPEAIPAGHKLTAVAAVPATCRDTGTEAYWKCSVCGKLFSDAQGENEIDAPVVIPTIPHTWDAGKVTTPATCTETGVTTYICTVCGETKTEVIPIDPDAHAWDEGKVTKAATATEAGEKLYTCQNDPAHTKTETIPPVTTPTPAPTPTPKPTTPTPAPTKGADNNPKTGDESASALWIAVIVLCGGTIVALTAKKSHS